MTHEDSTGAREAPQAVAVVGAGASGTLAAVALMREAARRGHPLRVLLLDRHEHGAGLAYGTRDRGHLLNVPASRMSAMADRPDDFRAWCERSCGDGDPNGYAPRAEYRRYLADVVARAGAETAGTARLARLIANVSAVEQAHDGVRLRLADGGSTDAQLVVLALGNLPAVPPGRCAELSGHPGFVNDPWAPGALDELAARRAGKVLLFGTGLTMVDVALTLGREPSSRLLAVSRSGLLPRAHARAAALRLAPGPGSPPPGASLPELVDAVLDASARGGDGWQHMADELRPHTVDLWRRLSLEERARFMSARHRRWSVHRHRMAPQVGDQLAALIARRRLSVHAGAGAIATRADGRFDVALDGAAGATVELVVNCTGPGLDPRASREPLVRSLLEDGLVRAHPLGLGFDTAADGSLRRPDGTVQRRLFTLGPPRFGDLYETIAIPEIRGQAAELADRVLTELAGGRLGARSA